MTNLIKVKIEVWGINEIIKERFQLLKQKGPSKGNLVNVKNYL